MAQYKIAIDSFQGPLDLLLQLIEANELDITTVSLAAVADQYVTYINTNPQIPPDEIADFLLIAARLIVIKSRALLPTLQLQDEDAIDLEKQLRMYKEYIEASRKLQKRISGRHFSYAKEKYPQGAVEGFHPPKKITLPRMHDIFELLLKRIEPIVILPKKFIDRVVTIREKISSIRELVLQHACISFQKMICEGSKADTIVGFLALLELVKQKIVTVDQEMHSGEIIITKRSGAEAMAVSTESEFI